MRARTWSWGFAASWLAAFTAPAAAADGGRSPGEVFERRILPIFRSPDPSSCVQCHLAGVDLKDYILPSQEKTFLSLRDQGLIDLDRPEESKILRLIRMGEGKEAQAGARLIDPARRTEEYEAFAEWIRAASADPELRQAPPPGPGGASGPRRPVEVIRHARADRVLASFEKNVWSLRFRCIGCHMPGGSENARLVEEHGKRVSWMKAEGPQATLDHLISRRLVDAADPERSLLLRKPLNEVKHGGGQKMIRGDLGYKAFRTWLEDYSRTVKDGYADAGDLPHDEAPERFGTDIWIKLADTPPAWGDRLLAVALYARSAGGKSWEKEALAVTDRMVWGKGRLWQHNLVLLAAPGSPRAEAFRRGKPALPAGEYLVRAHVDFRDRFQGDWRASLGAEDFVGEAVIEGAFQEGYGSMTSIQASALRR